jgi:hypothetical protein
MVSTAVGLMVMSGFRWELGPSASSCKAALRVRIEYLKRSHSSFRFRSVTHRNVHNPKSKLATVAKRLPHGLDDLRFLSRRVTVPALFELFLPNLSTNLIP